MKPWIVSLNLKSLVIIGAWSIMCSAAIVIISLYSHERVTVEMARRLDAIERHINEKTLDRYHGTEAKRDFAEMKRQLDQIRKDCGCAIKSHSLRM
jgi:hypothetical protein